LTVGDGWGSIYRSAGPGRTADAVPWINDVRFRWRYPRETEPATIVDRGGSIYRRVGPGSHEDADAASAPLRLRW
jgi:hypothetical protein